MENITGHELSRLFDFLCESVVGRGAKLRSHDLVDLFMGIVRNGCGDGNTLEYNGNRIGVDGHSLDVLRSRLESVRIGCGGGLDRIADRLIEDSERRRSGDFWTPTLLVDYAHDMISQRLGEDWKEKYVVWDNCCGGLNLTRDYRFGELYCSTLYQSELNIGGGYNPEAVKFQFDFLNDNIAPPNSLFGAGSDGLPSGLKNALLRNKPIVFFINPPYVDASDMSTKGLRKTGVAKSRVCSEMINDGVGACSKNLYGQFLYRIMKIKKMYGLTDCCVCVFCPALFLTGVNWKEFRKVFLREFSFDAGSVFSAGHFSDVKDYWGVSFSVWKSGVTADRSNFHYECIDAVDGEMKGIGGKVLYNADFCASARDWVREPIVGIDVEARPTLSTGITVKAGDNCNTRINRYALGCFLNMGNNVGQNLTEVGIFTGCDSSNANGLSIMKDNYERVIALFSARKLIAKNWVNSKDEYLAPDEAHPKYCGFVNDSVVYSLFQSASNQSSLRNIEYRGRSWNIVNEFFWMPKSEIAELARACGLADTCAEAESSKERYVYSRLCTTELSSEARAVLDKADGIVRKTFGYRSAFNEVHPEYQILNWDCGWYQIRALAKEYARADYDEFVSLFKTLESRMRPMVYELGFLK